MRISGRRGAVGVVKSLAVSNSLATILMKHVQKGAKPEINLTGNSQRKANLAVDLMTLYRELFLEALHSQQI